MKYILRIGALGKFPEIDINSDRFLRLKSSRAILTEALAVEEKYEIVISNYLDLEKELINVSVSEMVRGCLEYADFFDVRLALNIRLVNLLTSVRLYKDHLVCHHLPACLPGESGIKECAEKIFSDEYKKNFDYRFMEALRNHVQHRGTAVHRVAPSSKWTDLDDGLLEYSLYFSAKKEYLLADSKVTKRDKLVLNEMPDEVNLCSASRSCIESVSAIHNQVREVIQKSVTEARASIEAAINEYKSVYKDDFVGLHAYTFDGNKKIDEV